MIRFKILWPHEKNRPAAGGLFFFKDRVLFFFNSVMSISKKNLKFGGLAQKSVIDTKIVYANDIL